MIIDNFSSKFFPSNCLSIDSKLDTVCCFFCNINLDSSSDNIDEWDSMSQVLITSEISELTDGKSDDIEELFEATSVKAIIDLLKNSNLIEV